MDHRIPTQPQLNYVFFAAMKSQERGPWIKRFIYHGLTTFPVHHGVTRFARKQ